MVPTTIYPNFYKRWRAPPPFCPGGARYHMSKVLQVVAWTTKQRGGSARHHMFNFLQAVADTAPLCPSGVCHHMSKVLQVVADTAIPLSPWCPPPHVQIFTSSGRHRHPFAPAVLATTSKLLNMWWGVTTSFEVVVLTAITSKKVDMWWRHHISIFLEGVAVNTPLKNW